MEIITRKQAFTEGRTRFYTGRPCKKGHDCERYTSMGGCIECIRDANRPWKVPQLLRGSPVPSDSIRACQMLVQIPAESTSEQRAYFVKWVQHECVQAFFGPLGLVSRNGVMK